MAPRKCSDLELSRHLSAAGMAECVIKSPYFDTAARNGQTVGTGHLSAREEMALQIRAVDCRCVILTTDFGQLKSPYSDEGMAQYAALLLEQGFSETDLHQMMCENPKQLISLRQE